MITVPFIILAAAGGAIGTVSGMFTRHFVKKVKVLQLQNRQLAQRVTDLEKGRK